MQAAWRSDFWRFLLGFRKQRLGAAADQRILEVCERLGMADALLNEYRSQLPDSQYLEPPTPPQTAGSPCWY